MLLSSLLRNHRNVRTLKRSAYHPVESALCFARGNRRVTIRITIRVILDHVLRVTARVKYPEVERFQFFASRERRAVKRFITSTRDPSCAFYFPPYLSHVFRFSGRRSGDIRIVLRRSAIYERITAFSWRHSSHSALMSSPFNQVTCGSARPQ